MEYTFRIQSPENKELWCPRMGDHDLLIEGEQIWSFCFSVGAVHGLEGTHSTWVGNILTQSKSNANLFHRHPHLHTLTLWVSTGPVKLASKIDLCERQASKLQMKIFIFKQMSILITQTCVTPAWHFPLRSRDHANILLGLECVAWCLSSWLNLLKWVQSQLTAISLHTAPVYSVPLLSWWMLLPDQWDALTNSNIWDSGTSPDLIWNLGCVPWRGLC